MRLSARDAAEDQAWMDNPPSGEPGKRFLDDLESKRRIVEECENTLAHGDTEGPNAYGLAWVIARYLASVYAAHPDYDPSWRPAEVTA